MLVKTVSSNTRTASTRRKTRVATTLDAFAWFLRHDHKWLLLHNGLTITRYTGIPTIWVRLLRRIYGIEQGHEVSQGQLFTEAQIKERAQTTPQSVRFSIVVPLYNTPEHYLRPMIQSVLDQAYSRWELCLADGSDAEHPEVERVCAEYAHVTPRIHYRRLKKNLGIAGNTNEALRMATGDYVAFLDHDDMLHPAALTEVVRTICNTKADFLYTDECIFTHDPGDIRTPHFKPAFAPYNLVANNYMCHFSVCKRELLASVGDFCSECDGSQDHDMVLRIAEQATRIAHIPEVLYYWRVHPESVAYNTAAKPYTVQAGIRAVERHLQRTGQKGWVEAVETTSPIYRVHYELAGTPKVSIVIAVWGNRRIFWQSLRSVLRRTTYTNYEVIVLDCGSPHAMQARCTQLYGHDVRITNLSGNTSYAEAIRLGVSYATGEHLVLLAADLTVLEPHWMQELLMFSQKPDIGAVGGKIVDTRGAIQQAGLCLGVAVPAASYFRGIVAGHSTGYMGRLAYAQNVSAVSSECMMMRREVWDAMGGFDDAFHTKLADADLCMRMRAAGMQVVWTPFAELRGMDNPLPTLHGRRAAGLDSPKRTLRGTVNNEDLFRKRWKRELIQGDPYYSPNLTIDRQDFTAFPLMRPHDARVSAAGVAGVAGTTGAAGVAGTTGAAGSPTAPTKMTRSQQHDQ